MAHTRTQIRDAIRALLLPIAAFNSHIYTSRFNNLQLNELPSAVIYALQEPVQIADVHDTYLERDLTLNISIKAAAIAGLDTLLDDLAEDVELAIDADPTLGGKVKSISLTGCNIQIDEEAETPVGEALLQYQVNYFTPVGAPDQFS